LSRVSAGPFYQFQNSDDSEGSLSKLVVQLCRRIPGLEPDTDVVKTQVHAFKSSVEEVLRAISSPKKIEKKEAVDEGAVAKVLEEIKLIVRELPLRLEQKMVEGPERYRPRRVRRLHPMMIDEMAHMISRRPDDPLGILIIASLVREDFPWLYEIGTEAYRAAKTGSPRESHELLRAFRDAAEFTMRGPFLEEMGMLGKETHIMYRELPMIIDHYMQRLEKPMRKKSRPEESGESKTEGESS